MKKAPADEAVKASAVIRSRGWQDKVRNVNKLPYSIPATGALIGIINSVIIALILIFVRWTHAGWWLFAVSLYALIILFGIKICVAWVLIKFRHKELANGLPLLAVATVLVGDVLVTQLINVFVSKAGLDTVVSPNPPLFRFITTVIIGALVYTLSFTAVVYILRHFKDRRIAGRVINGRFVLTGLAVVLIAFLFGYPYLLTIRASRQAVKQEILSTQRLFGSDQLYRPTYTFPNQKLNNIWYTDRSDISEGNIDESDLVYEYEPENPGITDSNTPEFHTIGYRLVYYKQPSTFTPPNNCYGSDGMNSEVPDPCHKLGSSKIGCDVYASDRNDNYRTTAYCAINGTVMALSSSRQVPQNELFKVFDSMRLVSIKDMMKK